MESLQNYATPAEREEAVTILVPHIPCFQRENGNNNAMRSALIHEIGHFTRLAFDDPRDDEEGEEANFDDTESFKDRASNILAWWRNHSGALPNWLKVLREAVLLQPSSGGAERVFAMYTWMFDDDQEAALEDYKETSLQLRYNTIWRNK